MKHVVQYDIYLDILLVGSIYVTTSLFLKEHPKSRHPAKPCHPGLGTGMEGDLLAIIFVFSNRYDTMYSPVS